MLNLIIALTGLFPTSHATEVTAAGACMGVKVDAGDTLVIVDPCKFSDVPVEQSGFEIKALAQNMPMHEGGTFSKFTVSRQNESFEITLGGNPSIGDVRARRFKTGTKADECVHRRAFTLSSAKSAMGPSVDVKTGKLKGQ